MRVRRKNMSQERVERFILHRGFTLIESLVFLFIFALVSMAFLQTYTAGTRHIIESKNRLGATALANQKMEIIRSIDYEDIGTKRWNGSAWVYGIPAGDILEEEAISVNTRNYQVHTFVQYIDHPYDGTLGGSPTDTIPNDQKRIRLTVTWGNATSSEEVSLVSTLSPEGVETSAGGGVLSINVLNSAGVGVPNATVRIVNTTSSIDLTTETDATGNILLPGAPAGSRRYQLTISKDDYYGALTYPPYPTTAYNPVDVHGSVVAGTLNQKTIVSDLDADITLTTEDPFGTAIPNIPFTLRGGRLLGTNPSTGAQVYAFNQTLSTDSAGAREFSDQSYGPYTFSTTDSRYRLYKITPEGTAFNTTDVAAGSDAELTALLLDSQIGSTKITIKRQSGGSPISGASVRLTGPAGYDATGVADQYGMVYFPTVLPALVSGTYQAQVTATGFVTKTSNISVSTSLVLQDILLVAQ